MTIPDRPLPRLAGRRQSPSCNAMTPGAARARAVPRRTLPAVDHGGASIHANRARPQPRSRHLREAPESRVPVLGRLRGTARMSGGVRGDRPGRPPAGGHRARRDHDASAPQFRVAETRFGHVGDHDAWLDDRRRPPVPDRRGGASAGEAPPGGAVPGHRADRQRDHERAAQARLPAAPAGLARGPRRRWTTASRAATR